MKISIIDIGTQSIKHHIFDVEESGNKKLIYTKRFSEADLGEKETISPEAIQRNFDILKKCKEINDQEVISNQRIIGTDILRKASNAQDFLILVEELLGSKVNIISHEDEARYLYEGFLSLVPPSFDLACANVGGGSTELVIGNSKEMKSSNEIPFGVKLLRNNFVSGDDIDWKSMEEYLSANILAEGNVPYIFVTGMVLDFMSIVAPYLGFSFKENNIPQHPFKLPILEYEKYVKKLQLTPISKLKELFAKDPKYCENVAIGHTVYLETARKTEAEWVIPSNNDLTDGIIYELLKN